MSDFDTMFPYHKDLERQAKAYEEFINRGPARPITKVKMQQIVIDSNNDIWHYSFDRKGVVWFHRGHLAAEGSSTSIYQNPTQP